VDGIDLSCVSNTLIFSHIAIQRPKEQWSTQHHAEN
jgi:hypothetical protein